MPEAKPPQHAWMQNVKLRGAANRVFTPTAPIDRQALFAGRREELRRVGDAVFRKGQHALIYGERGVGKTSLANIIKEAYSGPDLLFTVARVPCERGDTYSSIWKKFFSEIPVETEEDTVGINPAKRLHLRTMADELPEQPTSDEVRRALQALVGEGDNYSYVVPILDEFDRVTDKGVQGAIADTIKALSDAAVDVTIVVVGVADTIGELIAEHASVERHMEQIHLQRMSDDELKDIIDKGLREVGLQIEERARQQIAQLSRGLPHYTHSLALHATLDAIESDAAVVTLEHVRNAVERVLAGVEQSTAEAYRVAVDSAKKGSLYGQVLLACALAETDEHGYFAPADLRKPMSRIMAREYDIPSYLQHLSAFCEEARGRVLQRVGQPRRYKYRFRNPMMQPYVTLSGIKQGGYAADQLLA